MARTPQNARRQLETELKKLLPKQWKIVPFQANLDALDRLTLMVKQETVKRFDPAPAEFRLYGFTVTLISPKTDPQLAEDDLDQAVETFLDAIEAAEGAYLWDSVDTNRVWGDSNFASDIHLTIPAHK